MDQPVRAACARLRDAYMAAHLASDTHEGIERAYALHSLCVEAELALFEPDTHVRARPERELAACVFLVAVLEGVDEPSLASDWRAIHGAILDAIARIAPRRAQRSTVATASAAADDISA